VLGSSILALRAIGLMRRGVKALERIATAMERAQQPPERRRAKVAEVFTPSREEMADIYEEEREKRGW